MRRPHIIFRSGFANFHLYQQYIKVPFSPHCHPTLFLVFLITAILMSLRQYLIVVPTCVSLTVIDVGHLFMFLLAICMTLEKCRPSAHFIIRLFFLLSCMSSFYILGHYPLIRNMICKYFLPFGSLPFHFIFGLLRCAEVF